VFRGGEARPPHPLICAFIDAHRHEYQVEPLCRVLEIAPSGYYAAKQVECDTHLYALATTQLYAPDLARCGA
jgi:hypothetical protein